MSNYLNFVQKFLLEISAFITFRFWGCTLIKSDAKIKFYDDRRDVLEFFKFEASFINFLRNDVIKLIRNFDSEDFVGYL